MLLYNVLLLASAAERAEELNWLQVARPSIPHARAAGPPTGRSFFSGQQFFNNRSTFAMEVPAETCVSDLDAKVRLASKTRTHGRVLWRLKPGREPRLDEFGQEENKAKSGEGKPTK